MKKLLLCFAILLLCVPAFASVAVQDNGTYEGEAAVINFDDSVSVAFDGSLATVYVGRLKNYESFATGDTLVAADSGKTLISTLNDADGILDFVLPAASAGLNYNFVVGNYNYIRIDPATTERIYYSTCDGGDRILSTGSSADSVTLISDGSNWYVTEMKGTWTDAN